VAFPVPPRRAGTMFDTHVFNSIRMTIDFRGFTATPGDARDRHMIRVAFAFRTKQAFSATNPAFPSHHVTRQARGNRTLDLSKSFRPRRAYILDVAVRRRARILAHCKTKVRFSHCAAMTLCNRAETGSRW
jgi:hypothetical protein